MLINWKPKSMLTFLSHRKQTLGSPTCPAPYLNFSIIYIVHLLLAFKNNAKGLRPVRYKVMQRSLDNTSMWQLGSENGLGVHKQVLPVFIVFLVEYLPVVSSHADSIVFISLDFEYYGDKCNFAWGVQSVEKHNLENSSAT